MATAVSLNAISSILNGQGLGTSPALLASIATYQAKSASAAFANCYVNSGISSSVTANIITELNTVGSTITSGHFLLDLYPGNITPTTSAGITPFSANLVLPVGSFFSALGKVYTVTGNIFSSSFDGNVLINSSVTGFSDIIKKQAQLPFAYGFSGFANVFQRCYGYSQEVFDTVSSINMLTNRTYSQSGVGYTGPLDLVTGGIGNEGPLLANVVSNWGTMYDINNLTQIGDPYVFGQNLLNQGLGYINALGDQLTAVGLDITDLPNIPAVITTVTQEEQLTTVSSFIGEIEVPVLVEVSTTVPVTGNSPTVLTNIYKTIIGSNLHAVVNATAITTSPGNSAQLLTLADYLDFDKVVTPDLKSQLQAININTFDDLGKYLGRKIGQGQFRSWKILGEFLQKIEAPTLSNLPNGPDSTILYPATISTLNSQFGTGSGDLGNPIMIDYLGACAGDPYTIRFNTINQTYDSVAAPVASAVVNLDQAIIKYCNQYNTYLASAVPDSALPGDPPVGDGMPPDPSLLPNFATITSNVALVNSALSSLPNTSAVDQCNTAVYVMLNRLSTEVPNLVRAGVVFGPAPESVLLSFGETIGSQASNKGELQTYQFFANIITNDAAGDSIRAVVAETINTQLLTNKGVEVYNNPDPRLKIYQSQEQNIPLSTYISRNK
jgi:hypothetical protein